LPYSDEFIVSTFQDKENKLMKKKDIEKIN